MNKTVFFLACWMAFFLNANSQSLTENKLTLEEVLAIGLEQNPVLLQYKNQESIVGYQVKANLSGWLPEVMVDGDYMRYFSQPTAIFPDFNNPESGQFQEVRTGIPFNSSLNFSVNQPLINNELIRSHHQASPLRKQAAQSLEDFKIELVNQLTVTFYEALLAQEQVQLTSEDIRRQEKQLQDAKLMYETGITDQIDYKRALINIQNSQSALYEYREETKIKSAQLNSLMGYPKDKALELTASFEDLLDEIYIDTLQQPSVGKRIEYQLLETRRGLQEAEIRYQKRKFIPSLSAFYNYNILYLSPVGNEIFDQGYPFSLVGVRINYPLFQGGRRIFEAREAALQLDNLELEQKDFSNQVQAAHQEAISRYKNQLYLFNIQERNKKLAEEIYEVVSLQYEEGIKNFLEVIVAETDLRTSRINYTRSLFAVLTSKLAVQRARGEVIIDY
ncbi:MAG TPA: TolC family protein [Lunatimonas sp.]|nr:TolC family protein [Lunatimonas sp.]